VRQVGGDIPLLLHPFWLYTITVALKEANRV
jgi:hypothetical protein